MNYQKKERTYLYCIIIISFLLLLPMFKIGFYSHPSFDDFGYSATTYHVFNETHSIPLTIKEAFENSIEMSTKWQGLYTSAFIQSLQPAIFGVKYYVFTSLIVITSIWASTFILAYYVLGVRFRWDKLKSISLACVICTVMTQFLPSAVEGIYWHNGAMSYTLHYSTIILMLTLFFSFPSNCGKPLFVLKVFIALVLSFLISGGNYVSMLESLIVQVGFLAIVMIKKKKRSVIGCSICLLSGLIGALLNVSAPGVQVRQNEYQGMSPIRTIVEAVIQGTEIIGGYWNGTIIFFVIISLPLLYSLAKTVKDNTNMKFSYPAIVAFIGHMLLCAMLAPPLYAMGSVGEGRLLNMVYLSSIIILFFDVFYVIGYILVRIDETGASVDFGNIFSGAKNNIILKVITCVATAVILVCCLLQSWAFTATVSICSGEAAAYEGEMYFRHNLLMEADEEVVLPVIRTKPEMLYHGDIADGPDTWPNTDLEKYYDVDRVYLETYFTSENK